MNKNEDNIFLSYTNSLPDYTKNIKLKCQDWLTNYTPENIMENMNTERNEYQQWLQNHTKENVMGILITETHECNELTNSTTIDITNMATFSTTSTKPNNKRKKHRGQAIKKLKKYKYHGLKKLLKKNLGYNKSPSPLSSSASSSSSSSSSASSSPPSSKPDIISTDWTEERIVKFI